MGIKKKLQTGNTIEAWTYESPNYVGISVGVFDKMHNNSKAMLSIESVNCEEGTVNRIVINKEKAEKYGFRIIFE